MHYGSTIVGFDDLVIEVLSSFVVTFSSMDADYKIVVRPTLATWSQAGYDTIFLQKLDLDNVRVVCSILAQSVALEHHLRKVGVYYGRLIFGSLFWTEISNDYCIMFTL